MGFKALYFVLSNLRLVHGSGGELSHEEVIKLWEFYNLFVGSRNSKLIMRVESDENLRSQFFADTKNPELLAECLFMTGEKGRVCWTDKAFVNPDDVSTENFENIRRLLAQSINSGVRGHRNRGKRMRDFYERNYEFCESLENRTQMAEAYNKLEDEDKRKVNLYYLSVVHTINGYEYKRISTYVSTTADVAVADQFTGDMCVYGWVPVASKSHTERYRTVDVVSLKDAVDIKHTGMPYCNTPVYPEQEEVAVRCGLLPHFILGFTVGRIFYVNPSIFTAIDKMHELDSFRALSDYKRKLQLTGLEVNQENFEKFIATRTNFRRFFTFDGVEYRVNNIEKDL